ncbi:MAG: radical SAM protein [Planctomycetota bacterium]
MYQHCTICEHRCGVDRTQGPAGVCQASSRPRVFCEVMEYGEEPEFVPAYAVSFSGCNLRCVFCVTGEESQDASAGDAAHAAAIARRVRRAVAEGARSAFFLGGEPTIHLPFLLDVASRLTGLGVPLVLKTNLYLSVEALLPAVSAFDVIVADFKFGSDACAERLGGFAQYVWVLQRNLLLAAARRRVVVRHLLMPSHVDCCLRPVRDWMGSEMPDVEFHVRDHYVPAFRAPSFPEIARTTTEAESEAARSAMEAVR